MSDNEMLKLAERIAGYDTHDQVPDEQYLIMNTEERRMIVSALRAAAASAELSGCKNEECRLIAEENADNVRLLDYIADKIGLPNSHELSESSFSGWLSSRPAASAEPVACELTADFTKKLPGGVLDDSTFEQIETALDQADAPCREGSRWLTLPERIAALGQARRRFEQMSEQRNIDKAEIALVWALDKASTSLEVREAVNKALGFVRSTADEIASLRAQISTMAREHDAYYAELTAKHFDALNQLASARKALGNLLEKEAKFITHVRDEDMPAFNDLKEARRSAKAALTDENHNS